MEADTSLVVIGFHKKYCHPDVWKTATTRPKSATAHWLKKLGAEPVDFLPPRSGGTDGVEVVARVQKDNVEKVLRGSVEFGVFSRTFFVKGDARVYKDVPHSVEFDLQAAMRKAKAVGPSILGVVLRGKNLGLRTKECDFESVVGQVYYSEEESKRFIGERWEATNLPLSWSKAVVQAFLFLAGWPCTVEASFPSREDQECHHPVSGAASRPKTTARFWVFAHPARGTTQTSKCTGPCVVKTRKSRWTRQLSVPSLPPRFETATRVPRRSRSRQGRNGWTPCNLRNLQCWQTWSRSYRYSWRRCSRLRQLSDSSGASCIPSKQKSR